MSITAIVIMKFITLLFSCIALGINVITLIYLNQLDRISKEIDSFDDDDWRRVLEA